MEIKDIEHMWKIATNNPNHDTNWHDPAVVKFAQLVEDKVRDEIIEKNKPVLQNVNKYIKELQDAVVAEREACAKLCDEAKAARLAEQIRARGQQ